MKNLKIKKNKGFTLIEMIVVISIIAILAAIIGATINKNIRQARIEKARTELLQLVTAINLARSNEGVKTISEVTEKTGTSWYYWGSAEQFNAARADSWDKISKKSGINVRRLLYDPWGYPYQINEFEVTNQTTGVCDTDRVGSEDHIYYVFPYATDYCKANPNPRYVPGWEYKYKADMEPDCQGGWWCGKN